MKKNKWILLIICLIFIVIGFIMAIKSVEIIEIINTDVTSLLTKKDVRYQVQLKENDAIEESVLPMNKSYVAKFVEMIKFDYNLSYSGSSDLEYTLNANLFLDYENANEVNSPNIVKKVYNIIPTTELKSGQKTVKETINFDYTYYNQEAKRIQNIISVPVNAYVDVEFQLKDNMTGTSYNSIYSIPLGEDVFSITDKGIKETAEQITTEYKIDEIKCIIGIAIVLIAAVIIARCVVNTGKAENKETYFTIKLKRILQSYGDIVVEMIEPIDLDNLQVRNVKNFEQLVDIEVELRKPIVFYETIPNKEGEFIIIQDDIAYRYILKDIKSDYKYKRKI